MGYAAINPARCALSVILPHIDGQTVGKHQLVHWFIHSVYERNPKTDIQQNTKSFVRHYNKRLEKSSWVADPSHQATVAEDKWWA